MSPRLQWALRVLEVQPDHRLLEIGCGNGELALKVARQLDADAGGSLIAIDRSPKLITRLRNLYDPPPPVVEFRLCELLAFDELAGSFDCIYAFNVGCFHEQPSPELLTVARLLAPEGRFYLFHQPPTDRSAALLAATREILARHGFSILETALYPLEPAPAFCVVAQSVLSA